MNVHLDGLMACKLTMEMRGPLGRSMQQVTFVKLNHKRHHHPHHCCLLTSHQTHLAVCCVAAPQAVYWPCACAEGLPLMLPCRSATKVTPYWQHQRKQHVQQGGDRAAGFVSKTTCPINAGAERPALPSHTQHALHASLTVHPSTQGSSQQSLQEHGRECWLTPCLAVGGNESTARLTLLGPSLRPPYL